MIRPISRSDAAGHRRGWLRYAALATLLLAGCGNDGDSGDTTDTAVQDAADAAADVEQDAAVDVGTDTVTGTLKWTAQVPPVDGKILGAAALHGTAGAYLLVGEDGAIVRLGATGPQIITVPGVGAADLRAVYVDDKGVATLGGDASILVQGSGSDWQLVPEIPPSPVTRFRGIDGAGVDVWAVGDETRAFRKDAGGTFLPVDVTVTDGEALAANANFVAVQVQSDAVWIAADAGSKSAGLVLEQTKDGWRSYPLAFAPRGLWRGTDGATWVVGGTVQPHVARLEGSAFVELDGLQWMLGFSAVAGFGADDVWLGALKGQVRRWNGTAFETVSVKAPPGTPSPFAQPSGDVGALALHAPDELLVATPFFVYRYGIQP
ncbi:MAG: hypothetical protein RIT45_4002 [Pseudomonadota bacterium]